MGSSLISERSYSFNLLPVFTPSPKPVEVLELDPNNTRTVVFSAALFSSDDRLVRVSPTVAGTKFPFISLSYDQGRVLQAVPGTAHLLEPSIPYYITVPPGVRLFASFRGDDMGIAALVGGSLLLSVSATILMEPSVNGQTKRLVAGFKEAIADLLAGLKK
jgi:hypothetical protein